MWRHIRTIPGVLVVSPYEGWYIPIEVNLFRYSSEQLHARATSAKDMHMGNLTAAVDLWPRHELRRWQFLFGEEEESSIVASLMHK
jgi:hypothetical protein